MSNMMPPTGGWLFTRPPNGDFRINLNSWQAKGLVGWWTCFGQNRNQVGLHDMLGRFYMTPNNTPTIGVSDFGPTILFDDASGEYLRHPAAVLSSAPITITSWFNNNDHDRNSVMAAIATGGSGNNYMQLEATGTAGGFDRIRFVIRDVASTTATTPTNYSPNIWNHACARSKASNDHAVFLNGGNIGTSGVTIAPSGMDETLIGVGRNGQAPFSGMIAETRIYNRALSDAEIFALWHPSTRWELYQPVARIWTGAISPLADARIPRYGFTNFQIPGIV